MKIFQLLFVLTTSSTLCLSWECCKKEEICKLPPSCKEILAKYPATPSGYYLIQPPGYSVSSRIYCDMENKHCGTKGWARVAHVNMSNGTQTCPGDFNLISNPVRSCGHKDTKGCVTANFSTYGIIYDQVCGKLRGYQVGTTDAFGPYTKDLDDADLVVDGVLISHGSTQTHIWTYATGRQKKVSATEARICPCTDPRFNGIVPPFIGNDYYCDSGILNNPVEGEFYTTPLWTGEGCTPPNFCCSQGGMPWFCKTLPVPTTNYIEIRNCRNELYEDTALDLIELYIR